jgi:hypothetical protein
MGNLEIVAEGRCFQRTDGENKGYMTCENSAVICGKKYESFEMFRGKYSISFCSAG